MDEYLRKLSRGEDPESEARYLYQLLKLGQIDKEILELASYLGYPATQKIAPYTGPPYNVDIRISPFCDILHNSDFLDVSHVWADNLILIDDTTEEQNPEPLIIALLLGIKFFLRDSLTIMQWFGTGALFQYVYRLYQTMARALENNSINLLNECNTGFLSEASYLQCAMGSTYAALGYYLQLTTSEEHEEEHPATVVSEVRHYGQVAFEDLIQLAANRHVPEFCQYISLHLSRYILGYRSLEETIYV